jgi:hypothetical protein
MFHIFYKMFVFDFKVLAAMPVKRIIFCEAALLLASWRSKKQEFCFLAYSSTLNIEAVRSSETSFNFY